MAILATDLFTLGANFLEQSSESMDKKDRSTALDEKGDVACESMTNNSDEFSNEFKYCGSDIKTDLGSFLTTFGAPSNSKLITGIDISFQAGQQPTVSVRGLQYPTAITSIQNADVSAAVPSSSGGVTVPTLTGVTLGAAASPISLNISFSLNHISAIGADGEVFTAENTTFTAEADAEYLGVPTTYDTVTSWTTDSYGESDSNSDHDRAKWTGHQYFDAT